MKTWRRKYPKAGYGGRFISWLQLDDESPYGSWGNGSAMRVSSVGWLYDTIDRTREVARITAEVTHNHHEGTDFEDVVRCAVSLGGDCDTLTCIAAGIAEAFYGVPNNYKEEALSRIEPDMRQVCEEFSMIRIP